MSTIANEINRRRTFAIISHPDAGKTTLTEKLLLFGGAISLAGEVKGKKKAKAATSDWMEIEKQRGISVTTSAMQFEYEGYCVNILDTPGHQDFSEDTYRTLMAADSAVMVIDCSKGVELQTRKLFKVCVMRGIPIFTFINKLDRESRDPFELCEEIEKELGIETYAVNWPIGCGRDFKGVYDRIRNSVIVYEQKGHHKAPERFEASPGDEALELAIGSELHQKLVEDIELLEGAGNEFDLKRVREGKLSPVFFGSALTNFGVEAFLEEFLKLTSPPLPRASSGGEIDSFNPDFSAFIFKIQANMNKAHRDRIAFMRVCSGQFRREMEVYHAQSGRKLRLAQPQQLMASEREIIETAYAGDVIGVFDPGIFAIGDTLSLPGSKFTFEDIPSFAPEHFARVSPMDTLKRKQFVKGAEQIAREGGIQIFKVPDRGMEEVIVGVVGTLQFDVLVYRMKNEYGVELRMESLPYEHLRYIERGGGAELTLASDVQLLEDYWGRRLLVFAGFWAINFTVERNKGLVLSESPPPLMS